MTYDFSRKTQKYMQLHPSAYNPGQNILLHVWFTSKTKLDIWYSKLGIQVAWRVAKRPKLKILGN